MKHKGGNPFAKKDPSMKDGEGGEGAAETRKSMKGHKKSGRHGGKKHHRR